MTQPLRSSGIPRPARAAATLVVAGLLGLTAAGCADPAEDEPDEPGAAEAATDEPRVFFEQPQDGDTVAPSFDIVLGHANVEIGAVPDEVDEPREGVVHHHLGLNTDCLEPGTEIPEADPWIHFGDGGNEIQMNLEPGEHRLTVQAGDDEHRTQEGLCETITVTVEEDG